MKAILTLSCEGRVDNTFKFCSGVENTILDLEKIKITEGYMELIDYLDNITKVFDTPCCKPNVITNAIYKMFHMEYLNDELYNRIADFYKFHNRCGLILSCRVKE